jgi:16S rRNA C1402 N4-methylase RsmH
VKFGNIEVTFQHVARAVEDGATQEVTMNAQPQEQFSASQRDIQTVAFNSNEDIPVKTEFAPSVNAAENIPAKENVPETRFVQVNPVKPEVKETAENNTSATQDRINFDFSKEE